MTNKITQGVNNMLNFNNADYYFDDDNSEEILDYHQAMALAKKGHNVIGVHSQLILSDSHGVYIPQVFYNNFDFDTWNLKKDEFPALDDPQNESYWDSWNDLLNNAIKKDDANKCHWNLEQEGDLFAKAYFLPDMADNSDTDWMKYL
jgi:hypothetical protein